MSLALLCLLGCVVCVSGCTPYQRKILQKVCYHVETRLQTSLEWFKSYLSDRTQFVSHNGTNSDMNITCGAPQGCIVIFVVY